MIDLRSDTFTVPTDGMRKAIYNAEVGDDVWGEDKTVIELQEYTAALLGKEAALYVPSGSMSNQLAIAVSTNPGDEIIVEADSHIFQYETAAPAIISRVQMKCIESESGMMPIEKIKASIRTPEYYMPVTSMVCLENTHNRHGGTIIEKDYIESAGKVIHDNNLKFHCDGARLWHASSARNITPEDFVKSFDSVSVCFSKGLGAPVGSALAGSKEAITKARKWRKILGGGMRQAGIIAAGALYAIKNHLPLLEYDHLKAKNFAKSINESAFIEIDLNKVQTNMIVFKIDDSIKDAEFVSICQKEGLLISSIGGNKIRAVFHFQIPEEMAGKAADIVKDTLNKLK